jgi:hypothetical protein
VQAEEQEPLATHPVRITALYRTFEFQDFVQSLSFVNSSSRISRPSIIIPTYESGMARCPSSSRATLGEKVTDRCRGCEEEFSL